MPVKHLQELDSAGVRAVARGLPQLGLPATWSSAFSGNIARTLRAETARSQLVPPVLERLTVYKSRHDRNEVQQVCKLYIKVMPAGYVRRFLVSEGDTVFHLYNMFNAHSNLGNSHSSMIVLPTIEGMFELRKELSHDTDEVLGETRGRDTMGDYGLIHKGSTVVMLYFSNYKPLYVPSLLSTFFEKNTTFVLPKLRTFNSVEQLPQSVPDDIVQKNLKMLIDVEYSLQQKEVKQDYIRRGIDYNRSAAAQCCEMPLAVWPVRSPRLLESQTLWTECGLLSVGPMRRSDVVEAVWTAR
jgi:hypothetical protein